MWHALLVGATDGIGRALAQEYLDRGWRVGVVGRDEEKLGRVVGDLASEHGRDRACGVASDVTETDRVEAAFEEALRELGQLDLLVYCAGVMEGGDTAESRGRAARRMFEVNAGAAAHFLELGADYLEDAGRGQLVAIGSVAGDRGRRSNPAYCGSKAGLAAYLEGLRYRLHGTGVTVSTVKPGWVKTRMLDDCDRPGAIEPEPAARRIADGLARGREVFYVPGWWRLVGLALRLTPRFLFKRFGPA